MKRRLSDTKHESKIVYLNVIRYCKISNQAELLEETSQEPVLEGVTFYARYLGHCLVTQPSGEQATGEAVQNIVALVRYSVCIPFSI